MQRVAGVGMTRRTHNKGHMRVEDVISTELNKVGLELRVEVTHQRVKERGGESGGGEGGDGKVIGWNLGSREAAWIVKRGGDVNIGGDQLRKDGLFFAVRVGLQRFV